MLYKFNYDLCNVPVGGAYCAPPKRYILPLVAAGALVGAGSFLGNAVGGLFSSHSSRKANKANLQIARETNASNERIQDKQNQFNLAMWNKENAYNTPAAQRQRYEEAGINPYFALGNIQGGNASSLLSADSAPMQGATMQPVDYSWIGNGINQATQTAATAIAAQGQAIDNGWKNVEKSLQVNQMIQDIKNGKLRNEYQKMSNDMFKSTFNTQTMMLDAQLKGIQIDNATKLLQQKGVDLDNQLKSWNLKEMAPLQKQSLEQQINYTAAQSYATYVSAYNQTRLTSAQIKRMAVQNATDTMNAITNRQNAQTNRMNAETNQYNAQTNRMVGGSQMYYNYSAGDNQSAQAQYSQRQFDELVDTYKTRLEILNKQPGLINSQTFNNYATGGAAIGNAVSNFMITPKDVFNGAVKIGSGLLR